MPKSIFDSEPPKDHIVALINYLCEFLSNSHQVLVPKEIREKVVKKVLEHYKLHIDTYNVPVHGIDPYKFISWAGLYLYEETIHNEDLSDIILKATIIVMNRTLVEEGRILPKLFLEKIYKMVKSEYRGKDILGLGKNGLYLTFRSASLCHLEDTKFDLVELEDIE